MQHGNAPARLHGAASGRARPDRRRVRPARARLLRQPSDHAQGPDERRMKVKSSGLEAPPLRSSSLGAGEPELKRRIWGSVLPRCLSLRQEDDLKMRAPVGRSRPFCSSVQRLASPWSVADMRARPGARARALPYAHGGSRSCRRPRLAADRRSISRVRNVSGQDG